MVRILSLAVLALASIATSFPQYGSLAGLSRSELDAIIPTLKRQNGRVPPPPPPLEFNGTKLVNNADHPFIAAGPDDMRGPCPGLNTLASHGYIPRSGIASPVQIIEGVMEGLNMGHDMAVFVAYLGFLVNGNPLTNLVSIGMKTPLTGGDPPPPAIVGGLDTHGTFEGDTSMTRGDDFFGDNHSFNETLFDEFVDFSNRFGGGNYTMNVAAELRNQRVLDSIATNPELSYAGRQFSAVAEAALPALLFIDGRHDIELGLTMDAARDFFQKMHMPDDFFRAAEPHTLSNIRGFVKMINDAHPFLPGMNVGAVNNYVVDPNAPLVTDICGIYLNIVNVTIPGLYPDPHGELLTALNGNLDNLFTAVKGQGCTQFFPYANQN